MLIHGCTCRTVAPLSQSKSVFAIPIRYMGTHEEETDAETEREREKEREGEREREKRGEREDRKDRERKIERERE